TSARTRSDAARTDPGRTARARVAAWAPFLALSSVAFTLSALNWRPHMQRSISLLAGTVVASIPILGARAQVVTINRGVCAPVGSASLSVVGSPRDPILQVDNLGSAWADGVHLQPVAQGTTELTYGVAPLAQAPVPGTGIVQEAVVRRADGVAFPGFIRT